MLTHQFECKNKQNSRNGQAFFDIYAYSLVTVVGEFTGSKVGV